MSFSFYFPSFTHFSLFAISPRDLSRSCPTFLSFLEKGTFNWYFGDYFSPLSWANRTNVFLLLCFHFIYSLFMFWIIFHYIFPSLKASMERKKARWVASLSFRAKTIKLKYHNDSSYFRNSPLDQMISFCNVFP